MADSPLHSQIEETAKQLEELEDELHADGNDELRERITDIRSELVEAALEDHLDPNT